MKSVHKPVLLQEVLEMLDPQAGETVLDGTLGGGGHARALAEQVGKKGTLIGLDQDVDAIDRARAVLTDVPAKVHTVLENFRDLDKVLEGLGIEKVDKILLDIGLSSDQLERSERGFSFQRDEPLLMTMQKKTDGLTAEYIVNNFSAETLETIFRNYGGERRARKMAKVIVLAREEKKITSTGELTEIIERTLSFQKGKKIHPATKIFQALRIATNDEYTTLGKGLLQGWDALSEGGRMAVISFHSLEDRCVKQFFREKKNADEGQLLTKKPLTPSEEERQANPRARSAKLRAIQKLKVRVREEEV